MPVTPGRAPDLAQQLWMHLTKQAGVEPRLARHVWRKLEASPDSLALRYAFTKALQAGPPSSRARYQAAATLVEGLGSPVSIMGTLEALVRARRLSRREATAAEEALLALVTRSVTWKECGRLTCTVPLWRAQVESSTLAEEDDVMTADRRSLVEQTIATPTILPSSFF